MEISVEQSGQTTIVKVAGKIDWESAEELDDRVSGIIGQGCRFMAISLENVNYICSGGIGTLVFTFGRLQKAGGAMYIISSNSYINDLFETLKFHIVFAGYLFKSFDDFSRQILTDRTPRA